MATGRPRPFGEALPRHPASISMGQPTWRPPADVVETATEVIVLVELAGVDHDQLDVLLFEDALIVEGERRLPAHAAGGYHAAQIRQGPGPPEVPPPAPRPAALQRGRGPPARAPPRHVDAGHVRRRRGRRRR